MKKKKIHTFRPSRKITSRPHGNIAINSRRKKNSKKRSNNGRNVRVAEDDASQDALYAKPPGISFPSRRRIISTPLCRQNLKRPRARPALALEVVLAPAARKSMKTPISKKRLKSSTNAANQGAAPGRSSPTARRVPTGIPPRSFATSVPKRLPPSFLVFASGATTISVPVKSTRSTVRSPARSMNFSRGKTRKSRLATNRTPSVFSGRSPFY